MRNRQLKLLMFFVLVLMGKYLPGQFYYAKWDTAYQQQKIGNHAEAIRFFKEGIELYKDSASACKIAYSYYRISESYKALSDTFNAKAYLKKLRVAQDCRSNRIENSTKMILLTKLGALWLAEKRFDSALYFFKQTLDRYPYSGINGYYNIYHPAIEIMQAYEGLGQADSAISFYLPYSLDSVGYEGDDFYRQDIHQFLILLEKKYSRKYLRKQFLKGIKTLSFSNHIDSTSSKNDRLLSWQVEFSFLGSFIDLYGQGSYFSIKPEADIEKEFYWITKKYYQQQLRSSYFFKLLNSHEK